MQKSDFPDAIEIKFHKGEYLFFEGEPLEYVFYLTHGAVRGNLINLDGNEFWADNVPCNQGIKSVVALGMLLSDEEVYSFSSVATEDSICYRIPSKSMYHYLQNHPEELFIFTKKLMLLYISLCKKLNCRQKLKTIESYCKFLLEHSEQSNGNFHLAKSYSNVKVSNMLGLHPVTLSRMQTALQNEGIIKKTNKGIIITDYEKLEQCAEGAYTVNYRKRAD